MLVASDEATRGSVIAKHDRSSPSRSGFTDVGRAAVEDFRRGEGTAERLAEMGVFVVVQALPFRAVIEEIPQPARSRLGLQGRQQRARRPSLARIGNRIEQSPFVRVDEFLHERRERRLQRFHPFRQFDEHWLSPWRRGAERVNRRPGRACRA
jgi:hypothetical protein